MVSWDKIKLLSFACRIRVELKGFKVRVEIEDIKYVNAMMKVHIEHLLNQYYSSNTEDRTVRYSPVSVNKLKVKVIRKEIVKGSMSSRIVAV